MRQIDDLEAAGKFSALLDEVERGEEVVILRAGKPVARLIASPSDGSRSKAEQAADRIIARRRGVTLGGLKIRDLIDEGRS